MNDQTLRQKFEALHAERVATMDPAYLKTNIDQRRELVETLDRSRFVKAGDLVEPFTLEEVEAGPLTLDDLLAQGPAVLVFFRFAGCPACNIALPHYRDHLAAGVAAAGGTLVAISPQIPERLVEIKRRHDLGFAVATDRGNALARRLGVTYTANEASKQAALAKGVDLGELIGTGTWELPIPTVVVIDQNRRVRFADVSPDWLIRTEAEPVLAALAGVVIATAA